MDPFVVLITVLVLLALLLGTGVWVGLSLFAVAITSLALFRSMPVDKLLAQLTYNTVTTPEMIALPMFILMAEILFHTRLSASLFRGLSPWTNRLPGKMVHVNVLGCTLFAAISGSSAATATTVGRITLSELFSRGYNKDLVIGSLAGAGTLGFLIPPSIILIIYGVLSETSILKLFIAGIVPGLILALGFMGYLAIRATLNPSLIPSEDINPTWRDRLNGLVDLGPVVFLILLVLGSMFALIVAGAVFLSVAMGFLGVPRLIAGEIAALGLSPLALILLLLVFYAILGCVLDGLSAIVMTLPITLPLIISAGFEKIWFGVFVVIVVEMAQITPPVGFNLFVIQGLTGETIGRVARAALPFFIIMFIMAMFIALVPDIVMFLPNTIKLKG